MHKDNRNSQPKETKQNVQQKKTVENIIKGQVMEYCFTGKIEPDIKGKGYVGKDNYKGYYVLVFDMPKVLPRNSIIQIKVSGVGDNKFYANYLGKKGDI